MRAGGQAKQAGFLPRPRSNVTSTAPAAGFSEARESAVRDLALQAAAGVLGVVLLLALAAGNWRNLVLCW